MVLPLPRAQTWTQHSSACGYWPRCPTRVLGHPKDIKKIADELFVLFGLLPVIGLSCFKQHIFCQSNNIYFADDSELPKCIHFAAGKSGGLLLWTITLSIVFLDDARITKICGQMFERNRSMTVLPLMVSTLRKSLIWTQVTFVNKLSPLGVLLLLSMFAAKIPDVHGTCFIIWMCLKMGCTSNMDQHCNQRRGKHEALNQWMI